jgi:hypothetical protein
MSPAAVLYTLGSITIQSLASVYNEFALKKNMETSVLLQNFFLYFYGACFNVVGVILLSLFGGIDVIHKGLFAGFTTVTFALIVNNAFQGILSSFFFKFADTILKKYSSTIATILTGLMSAALFGHPLTLNFVIGVSVVFISMHLFFSLGTYQKPFGLFFLDELAVKLSVLCYYVVMQEAPKDNQASPGSPQNHHQCNFPQAWTTLLSPGKDMMI